MIHTPQTELGLQMAQEVGEITDVVVRRLRSLPDDNPSITQLARSKAIYTIARGSSDAVACVLAYEFMRELRVPVTSLPPSVFSLHDGVDLADSGVMVISQSGASDDLVRSATVSKKCGASVVGITNHPKSKVEAAADATIAIDAGPELAVPATKTVVGGIAAGMALLAKIKPEYITACDATARVFEQIDGRNHPAHRAMVSGLLRAQNVYVIGRGAGLGAAQEIALKLKECCALHAEAYSSSEVLHGPLQLVTKPLTIVMIDTGEPEIQNSLNTAQDRFTAAGSDFYRVSPADFGATGVVPAAGAAVAIAALYPVICDVAVSLGLDPDKPATLSKVTVTR